MKTMKKVLSVLLVAVMLLTAAPLQGFVGLEFSEWFASIAEAAMLENGYRQGELESFTTIYNFDLEYYIVSAVTIDGQQYDLSSNYKLKESDAKDLVNVVVLFKLEDSKVTKLTSRLSSIKNYIRDPALAINYKDPDKKPEYKNGYWSDRKIELQGEIEYGSKSVDKSFNQFLQENNYLDLSNISLKFTLSADQTTFKFKNGKTTETKNIDDILGVINDGIDFDINVYIDKDYVVPDDVETFITTIKCELTADVALTSETMPERVTSETEFDISVENTGKNIAAPTVSMYDMLSDMATVVYQAHNAAGYPEFANAKGHERLENIQWAINTIKTLEGYDLTKINFDMLEAVSEVYGYATKNPTSTTFLNVLLDEIEYALKEEVDNFDALKKEISNDIKEKTDYFDSYVKWYSLRTYQKYSNFKTITIACPVNIEIVDEIGDLILSVVDDSVVYCDERVYACVTEESAKIVHLPSDIDHIITITATDNGTMDYAVSEYTPGGTNRIIKYEDVPLTVNEAYEAVVPNELMLAADNYNLTSNLGEVVECDTDTLPPIQDNIVDVIVAEELFDGFPVEIIDLVADTMFNMQPVVDLTAYDISTEDAVALFSAVAKYYPAEYSLLTHGDFTYKIIVSPNLDRIMKIRFYYGDDANLSTYQKRVNDLNAEIDALVAQVEGMNEFEKALYIHDYIVLHSEYDLELLEYKKTNGSLPGELRSEKYTEYSIFVNGTGVCGSYALAYRAVLNAAGMECLYLSSRSMNHAWNLVKIDGNWYHVDCCWDDPVPDTYGRARRTYFLRTDKEIMDLQHYSWSPGQYKAISALYSDMPRNDDSEQKYDDGKWYYLSGKNLYECDVYGNNETLITSVSASTIDADGGSIYYFSGRYIYEYVTDTQETNFAYMLSSNDAGSKPADAYFSNIYVDGNTVEFYKTIYDDENNRITVHDNDELQREKLASVTGITISQSEVTLNIFDTTELIATIEKTDGVLLDDSDIEWSSSNKNIVRIDTNGSITATNVGTTTVIARFLDYSATCEITVTGDGLSGMCGNNVRWTFEPTDGTLTLSGSGEMTNFSEWEPNSPWFGFRENIKTISIGDSITRIGNYAFYQCYNIDRITIPCNVTDISNTAFISCNSLSSIIVAESNEMFCSENGVLYDKDKTRIIRYPAHKTDISYAVPDGITRIEAFAFFECKSLTSVIIPDSVISIGSSAFSYCESLTSITIPDSVTNIGISAFSDCTSLTSITIPDSVTNIGTSVFAFCKSLPVLIIPDNITKIGMGAFVACSSLYSVIIPDSVDTIHLPFFNCDRLNKVLVENPECSYVGGSLIVPSTTTLYGYSNSTTQTYAEEWGNRFVAIDAVPHMHDYFLIGYKEATETTDGYEYWECYCGEASYTETLHYYGEEVATEPTCVTNGNKTQTCVNCGEVNVLETIPATGKHTFELVSTVPGTCEVAPVEHYKCAFCDATTTKEGKIEDGHKLTVEVIAPTCDEKGYTKEVCTVCGETMISEFTSPLGHSFIITRSADYCEAHGSITYECRNCDYTETVASDPANLVTETVVVDPTCTKSGTKSEICTLCGATVSTEILNPLSHDYAEEFTVDLEATCTTAGRKSQHCTRCDAKRAVTEIESFGHTAQTLPYKDATCTETGLTEGKKCSVCGEVLVAQAAIDKTSHKPTMVGEKAATATQDGYTGDTVCATCGMMIEKGKVIPATGDSSDSSRCDHLCHKDGILGFFWKILRLFFKLFQINPVCECGAAHY